MCAVGRLVGQQSRKSVSHRRPEGDQTRIRVFGNYRDGMMALTLGVGPIAAAATGALAAALGAATAFIILPAALVGGAFVSIGPFRYLFRREARSLSGVLDAVERQLLKSVPPEDG